MEALQKTLDQWGVDPKAGCVIVAGATVVLTIVKSGKLEKEKIKCAIDTCIRHYDAHPILMTALGAAISVALLYDSYNDCSNRKTKAECFEIGLCLRPEDQPKYWKNLRDDICYLRNRQAVMGSLKFLAMITFGYVAFASSAPLGFRAIMWANSATCGVAATIKCVQLLQVQ